VIAIDPTADAIARLVHIDVVTHAMQLVRRAQAGESRADHDHTSRRLPERLRWRERRRNTSLRTFARVPVFGAQNGIESRHVSSMRRPDRLRLRYYTLVPELLEVERARRSLEPTTTRRRTRRPRLRNLVPSTILKSPDTCRRGTIPQFHALFEVCGHVCERRELQVKPRGH
jgi:hypothetical protein